jgi:hypothetical protein
MTKNSTQKTLFDATVAAFAGAEIDLDRIRRIRGICFRGGVLKNDEGMRQAFRVLNRAYLAAKSETKAK